MTIELCHVSMEKFKLSKICEDDYSSRNEERNSFLPNWTMNRNISNISTSILNAFRYRSGNELDTYIYVGDHGRYASGGYVYEFRGSIASLQSNLSQLHSLNWIDAQTRAVLIQLSLYNPNINTFISVTILAEFLSTGQIIPSARIEPINLESNFFLS